MGLINIAKYRLIGNILNSKGIILDIDVIVTEFSSGHLLILLPSTEQL